MIKKYGLQINMFILIFNLTPPIFAQFGVLKKPLTLSLFEAQIEIYRNLSFLVRKDLQRQK